MTDNEIIKDLQEEIHLIEYVNGDYSAHASLEMLKGCLDLINRQNAEINRLKNELHGKADGIRDMRDWRQKRGIPLTDNISRFVSAMVHKRKGKYGVEWVGIAGYEVVETIPYSADITECPLPFIFKMFVVVGSTKKRVEYKIKKETGKIDREIIQAERGKERQ